METGRAKQKSPPILEPDLGGLSCLPRTLSVEELDRLEVPGQVSWLSGRRQTPSLPFPDPSGSVAGFLPQRVRLADYSGGTAADFHGLSFYLRLSAGGHRRNLVFKDQADEGTLTLASAVCQQERKLGSGTV